MSREQPRRVTGIGLDRSNTSEMHLSVHYGRATTGAPDLLVADGWGLGAVPLELPSISPAHHTLLSLAIVGYTFYRRAIKIAILAL